MSKVNPDAYGTTRPKIEPADLEDDVAILVIVAFEEVEVDDPTTESGRRMSGFLTFQQTGDKVCWLNKTAIVALIHYYGDNSDEWEGQECPVEKVKGTAFGKSYHKVNVVPQDAWPEYIPALEPRRKPKPKVRKVKAAKRKRTRGRK